MTPAAPAEPKLAAEGGADGLVPVLASTWLTFGLLVVAIVQQVIGHLDCDVSWFITFAEQYLDGKVPYVKVGDPNPPLAFLSLVPAVWIARALHIAVEPVVASMVFALAAASIALSGMGLRRGDQRSHEDWGILLNGAIFLLLVVPEIAFGEREHLALLLMAPMLALMAVQTEGASVPAALRLIAGIGAGLAVCFKPYFILAIALPALYVVWRKRDLRLLCGVEVWLAAAVCGIYLAVVFKFFPAYAAYALPVITDVYAPARDQTLNLLMYTPAPFNIALLAGFAIVACRNFGCTGVDRLPAAAVVCALASAGFLASFFIQGKGWINHAYPGVALSLFAWIFLALDRHPVAQAVHEGRIFKFLFVPALIIAPAVCGALVQVMNSEEHPGLRIAIQRVAPANPKIIAMARQLDFGHPVTRQVGGTWVGRVNALWTTSFVAQLLPTVRDPAWKSRLEDYRRRDLQDFAEDVRINRPDVVIVENKGTREYIQKRSESANVLDGYQQAASVQDIEIWTRLKSGRDSK